MRTLAALALALALLPAAAAAQDADPADDSVIDNTVIDPMPAPSGQPDPRDPNTVISTPTTFPKGQTPPVPGVQQGPLADWSGFYAGAGAGLFTSAGGSGGISARAGWQSDRLFGFEGEYTSGLSDFEVGINQDVTAFRVAEIDSVVAGFARVRLPVDNRIGLFARLGYHQTSASFVDQVLAVDDDGNVIIENGLVFLTDEFRESDDTFDGLATGLGVEVSLTEMFGLRGEFTRYDVGGDLTLNYLAVGGQVRF